MGINVKKPPIRETVGAQYLCFAVPTEDGAWQNQYETDVEKTEVVKSVKVTENTENTDVYASGKVYDTDETTSSTDVEVQVIAFPADTLAKARADSVDTGGLVLSGGKRQKPYFAYGKTVVLKGGKSRFEWYPKCKLSENTDEASTREEKFAEQTDTITIKAYPFNNDGDVKTYVDATMAGFPEGLTEEKFFAKPILTKEDLAAAVSGGA